jgi:hypothetical protein
MFLESPGSGNFLTQAKRVVTANPVFKAVRTDSPAFPYRFRLGMKKALGEIW